MVLAAVGGHGGAAETEKDRNRDDAEVFHLGNLQVDRASA
jgi:hypothetical protein